MNNLTDYFNQISERQLSHELILWLIFVLIVDANAQQAERARKRLYRKQMAFRF